MSGMITLLLLYFYFTFTFTFTFTLLYFTYNMIMYACLSVYGKDSDQFQTECAYLCISQSED